MSNNHTHHHGHHCSCSHDHNNGNEHKCCGKHKKKVGLSELSKAEQQFLEHLSLHRFLPVAQFVLKSSKESEFESVALSPVFITELSDSMEQVKNFGNRLKKLEQQGFITLDYDIPIDGYSYSEYYNSQLFEFFKSTVEEGRGQDRFLGDIATLQAGSIALVETQGI